MHIDRWEELVTKKSGGAHKDGRWYVSFPFHNPVMKLLDFSIREKWDHYRHPQVLQVDVDGEFFEIVGCHLRSKHTQADAFGDADDDRFFSDPANATLVSEMIADRVKLTTECADIRYSLDARFDEEQDAAIVVMGDLNDGPGKERIERHSCIRT